MNTHEGQTEVVAQITDSLDGLVQRVQRSMVQVKNGGQGMGAGIIWRENGVILTNNHVIQRGRLMVSIADGKDYPAEVLDRDSEIDLALLKIDAERLPVAMIADARSMRVGELVLAIGHPWGQRDVVTAGVISGLSEAQTRGPRKSVQIIRSDVLLAPGNSGGPMVNARGAVVGINTMIIGGDQAVAIPSHLANTFVQETLDRQVILGVGVQPVPIPGAAHAEMTQQQEFGLLVVDLTPAGPATKAGVLQGDILVELDGVPLNRPRALLGALLDRSPGEQISLGLLRGGKWQQVSAALDPLERMM